MDIAADNRLLLEFLFVKASYEGAREPAVLLLDLDDKTCRWLWDGLLDETWAAWAPSLDPAELLVLNANSSHLGGLATGRFRLMRVLRDHLGETEATKMLVEPLPDDQFFVIVMAGGTPTLATAPLPPRKV